MTEPFRLISEKFCYDPVLLEKPINVLIIVYQNAMVMGDVRLCEKGGQTPSLVNIHLQVDSPFPQSACAYYRR